MPQRLLLEGSDLEALMLRAREDYGPGATIVSAEKVRSGGFLGFFTREHFELTIEVPDAMVAALEAMERHPSRVGRGGPATPEDALAAEIADAQAAREALLADAVSGAGASSFATMRPSGPSPLESSDMAEFDRLVLQLTAEATSAAIAPEAPATAEDAPSDAPGATEAGEGSRPPVIASFVAASFPVAAPSADTAPQAKAQQPDAAPEPAGIVPAEGGVLHRYGVFADVAGAVATECTVPALLALGVPLRCVEGLDDLHAPVSLLEVVARFGVPPVRRPEPGDLVVVAGEPADAVAVATQLAAWMGMPATSVLLAGECPAIKGHGRRLRTEAEAGTARRKADAAAAAGEPLIVALGMAPGRRGAAAAAPMLAALGADTAWAVVDATKRAAVHAPALRLLASQSRIDGLAAVGLAEAQAPAAIVESEIPVAWMDGLPAASVVWAALLGERIALGD